jgi:carboxylesterase type B
MKSVAAVAALAATAVAGRHAPAVHDHHNNVTYRGVHLNDIENFFGIPFAQDTSGQYRFQPPRPYVPAAGTTFYATERGPACPQALGAGDMPLYLGNIIEISEDCLRLNVYRPYWTKAGDKLPVLVHIHGGGFSSASKDEPTIQPGGLILQSVANGHPVMQVNINYRLGVFGFAKSDYLTKHKSANAGLKDQRLALEWVKEHIEAFGGDPEKITIFGQSSGGLAVGMQILAYGGDESKPAPFQQAICESQAMEGGITRNFTATAMENLVEATGCNTSSVQSAETIACLRNLTMKDLLDAQTDTADSSPSTNIGDQWLPAVDGDILPDAPSTLISEGRFANVTAMMGWCEDDTNPFTPTNITEAKDTRAFLTEYVPALSPESVERMLELYPVSDFQANPDANLSAEFYRSGRMLRDILMVCQPYYFGQAITSKKGRDVYLYEQNQTFLTDILNDNDLEGMGVVHTSEFAYVFGNLSHYDVDGNPYCPNATDYALRDRESRSWSTFATFGHPSLHGHNTLKGWTPAFGSNETALFVIGGPNEGLFADAGPRSSPALEAQKLKERCGFINSPEVVKQWGY